MSKISITKFVELAKRGKFNFKEKSYLLSGVHGIGKTEIVATVIAKEQNIPETNIFIRRLAQETQGDVQGIPDFSKASDKHYVEWKRPSWLVTACTEPSIVFLDEIDRCFDKGVLQSYFQLLEYPHRIGNDTLHKDSIVIAACNGLQEFAEQYDVAEMDIALKDRFSILELTVDVKGWLNWYNDKDYNNIHVSMFIDKYNSYLHSCLQDNANWDDVTCSPRTWVKVGKDLNRWEQDMDWESELNDGTAMQLLAADLPNEIVAQFINFIKTNIGFGVADIYNERSRVRKIVLKDQKQYFPAINAAFTEMLKEPPEVIFRKFMNRTETKNAVFNFLKELDAELAVAPCKNIIKHLAEGISIVVSENPDVMRIITGYVDELKLLLTGFLAKKE